ncbi:MULTISPECIES: hypothetical protein [unclassified Caballeronia]|uniref:hypothetical protein n=1 Tax=unclassified Caballeronia TaxID=2646786 RepID=UPI002857AF3A|nr:MULTISPECIES: hypothetical protein [unclassified Caballeronia]MDR5816664.1 hypothetical protein [Caballeronia sp. LZ033]MDR5823333.1 hypothetical protein [Caballeronia sp. LZ043]MDR5881464.1 hypothetical protein [Caballeronia sp. LZ032]
MQHILTRYWQTLSTSVRERRDRSRMRAFQRVRQDCACGTASGKTQHDEPPSRTERLETIALYARAGYFNMGYTVDVFQSPADLPPE